MINCTGCGRHFSVRGYTQHVYSTSRKSCIQVYRRALEQLQDNEEADSMSNDEDMEQGDDEEASECPTSSSGGMPFSRHGEEYRDEEDPWPEDGNPDDTVGKYANLSLVLLKLMNHLVDWPPTSDSEDGDDISIDQQVLEDVPIEDSGPTTPPRPSSPPTNPEDGDDISIDQQVLEDVPSEDSGPTTPLHPSSAPMNQQGDRDQTHTIVSFPSEPAGAPITATAVPQSQYGAYQALFGDNIYAPFTSETDWWMAQWAKTRGPSSTAVNELLAFVCILFHVLLFSYLFCVSRMKSSISHTRIQESSMPSSMTSHTGRFSDVRILKLRESP